MRAVLAFTLCMNAALASAESLDVPKVDVDTACRSSDAINGSLYREYYDQSLEARYGYCVKNNQQAYELLKKDWPNIGIPERRKCLSEIKSMTYTTYNSLAYCADYVLRQRKQEDLRREQEEQVRRLPKKEFRY